MFGGFAIYARKRRILWIPVPAQDTYLKAKANSQRHLHDVHLPLLADLKSHH